MSVEPVSDSPTTSRRADRMPGTGTLCDALAKRKKSKVKLMKKGKSVDVAVPRHVRLKLNRCHHATYLITLIQKKKVFRFVVLARAIPDVALVR